MANFVPEMAPEARGLRGPGRAPTCRKGHLRSEHGRKQTKGRDAGMWACKECERIRMKAHKERKRYYCVDCGKLISIGAVQCAKCRRKDKTDAQPVYCTVTGCRAKARRRGMCAPHYWKARGEAKIEQFKQRNREATAKWRENKEAVA